MIQAKELRVGNKMFVGSNIWTVESIITGNEEEVYFIENNEYNHAINMQPIPLTPEILGKCGFELNTVMSDFYKHFFGNEPTTERTDLRQSITIMDGSEEAELCRSGICFKRVPCKYLHQLQNLYFALTGEELVYNL